MNSQISQDYILRGTGIQAGYQDKVILPSLEVKIPKGQITSIIGPNGCGKSTLLKTLARILPLQKGEIFLEGTNMKDLSTKEIARRMSMLPQAPQAPAGLTVEDLVSYGRYPYQSGFGILSPEDHAIMDQAMKTTGVYDLAARSIDQLSGGQRQRAWIAMALAQDTELILLDEPTTYLDMAHQLEVLQELEKLNKEQNKTIVIVIHDLNLAARFSNWLIAMRDGQIRYEGTPQQIFTPAVLADVFSLDAYIEKDPWEGCPVMVTYRLLPKDQDSSPKGSDAQSASQSQAKLQ